MSQSQNSNPSSHTQTIDFLTLFPEAFSPMYTSIPQRAQDKGIVTLRTHNLRDWGVGKHAMVDDTPYGGGPGMVMKPEPFFLGVEAIKKNLQTHQPATVINVTPQGKPFTQQDALHLSLSPHLIFLCGHYEGIDHRVREHLVDQEYSIGDYVLSNGELAAMVIADAIIRLLPGVIRQESVTQDSFQAGLLDHPHYTKPASYRGLDVPSVLLGGHHQKISEWREQQARETTKRMRPDLLAEYYRSSSLKNETAPLTQVQNTFKGTNYEQENRINAKENDKKEE